ncbi:MAG: hypothetical protein ACK4OF_06375 [Aquificaceae bacterium]
MFYVSKVSIPFFFLAIFDLFYSLFLRSFSDNVKTLWIVAVFGFIAHTIMGAMYQIVPNAQGRILSLPRVSYLVFLLSLLSSFSFYLSYYLVGSVFYLVASLIFIFQILLSTRNFQPVTVRFLLLGSFYFFLASHFLFLSQLGYVPFALAIHALAIGFMLNVVVGVELAWMPMLYMEPLNLTLSRRLFYLSLISTPPLLVSFYLSDYRLIALTSFLVLSFVGYYLYILYSLFTKRRMPKEIPFVIRYFLMGLFILPFGLLVGVFMAGKDMVSHMVFLHFDLLVYGFTATTIMGGFAHLYPRIVYNMRFSKVEGVYISDLVDEKAVRVILPSVAFALAWMVFSEAYGKPLSLVSNLLYSLVWAYFVLSVLVKVLRFSPKAN